MKRSLLLLTLAALLAGPARAEVVNRIVAVVDDEIITQVEVDREAATLLPALAAQNGWTDEEAARHAPDVKAEVLKSLIREKLFAHEVAKLGIPVSEADIDEYLDYLLSRNKMTRDQLAEMIRKEGKTIGEYRDLIKTKIQREQYVQYRLKSGALDVSDEEIRAYYQRNPGLFAVEPEVTIAELRLSVPDGAAPEEEAGVLARAEEAYGKLLAGESFESVARKYSDAPTAADGGLVGTFKLHSELKPAYARVAQALEPGKFSGIARDDRDAFVLKLIARPATAVRPLDEVRDDIKNFLYNEKVDRQIATLTDELYRKSFVDVRVEKF